MPSIFDPLVCLLKIALLLLFVEEVVWIIYGLGVGWYVTVNQCAYFAPELAIRADFGA